MGRSLTNEVNIWENHLNHGRAIPFGGDFVTFGNHGWKIPIQFDDFPIQTQIFRGFPLPCLITGGYIMHNLMG
jgi:hypothetical protein